MKFLFEKFKSNQASEKQAAKIDSLDGLDSLDDLTALEQSTRHLSSFSASPIPEGQRLGALIGKLALLPDKFNGQAKLKLYVGPTRSHYCLPCMPYPS